MTFQKGFLGPDDRLLRRDEAVTTLGFVMRLAMTFQKGFLFRDDRLLRREEAITTLEFVNAPRNDVPGRTSYFATANCFGAM
jgi:hypothetical protein